MNSYDDDDPQIQQQLEFLTKTIVGNCLICKEDISLWDEHCGSYGIVRRGENAFHYVCKTGKLAVAF